VETLACNEEKCFPNVRCNSKVDVVLVLDGSGSIGQHGFDQTKKFAKAVVNQMHVSADSALAGVVLFSRVSTIVSGMSSDPAALTSAIDSMDFPHSYTATGDAIMTALNLLAMGGRQDATSVIFVVTDGVPTWKDEAIEASDKARTQDSLRLVFAGVGNNADYPFMETLASFPAQQNVIYISDYDALDAMVGDLVADMCPILDCPETMSGKGEDYQGCQTTTRSGAACKPWGQTQYMRNYNPHYYPNKGIDGAHSFCRNPDGDSTIWCITDDPSMPWGFCDPRTEDSVPFVGEDGMAA